ncbi:hypothetical protein GCM10022215_39230 [Nocardioides fonticola]|uniref:DUF3137 domain-containing protein n=1 Tax=Nocardioides fonticola TaxID=450363 RepID=A0ABP7XYQ3_9ACTN
MLGLIIAGVLLVGVLLAYLSYLAEKRRREALAAYAAGRGWSYTAADPALTRRFAGDPFGRGFGRRATNVIRGTHLDRRFTAFDYRYKERHGNGKESRTVTYRYCLTVVELGVWTPGLVVDPENFLERFAGRLFNTDIELESEDFNRAFRINSPDRRFASAVLHPRMMEHLMRFTEIAWRFEGDAMLLVEDGEYDPTGIDARLGVMDSILDLVPEFLWQELKEGRA